MKKISKILLASFLAIIAVFLGFLIYGFIVLSQFSLTHLEANEPPAEYLDEYLERDVMNYFNNVIDVHVTLLNFEFLREGASQVGLAEPKYYVWVSAYDDDIVVEEGALYLAAAEQQYFRILNFFSVEEIIEDPSEMNKLFPNDVMTKIEEKVAER
ncbi:MAG: hypothetical protein WC730_02970 [Patescibacteria group bacterium]|jgi:hypothetical protein